MRIPYAGTTALAVASTTIAACSAEPVLIAPPWTSDRQGVLFLVDDDLETVGGPHVVAPSDAASFVFDDAVGRRLLALAYPSTDDGFFDLSSCGIVEATEPTQTIAAAPEGWLSSEITDDGRLEFRTSDLRRDLALLRCDPDPCPAVRTAHWSLGVPGGLVRGLDVLDDGDAIVAITDPERENSWLARVRDGEDVWRHHFDGLIRSAVWDGADTIYTFVAAELLAFDLAGEPRPVPRQVPRGVRLGSDHEGHVAATAQDGLFSLDDAWPPVAGSFSQVVLVPGSGLADDPRGLWRLSGATWVLEVVDTGLDRFGGDAIAFVAFNEGGAYLQYRDGAWGRLDPPSRYVRMATATGLGDGRFVLAGDDGKVAFQTPRGWCELPPEVAQRFAQVVASGSGRTITLASEPRQNPEEAPIIYRIGIEE